MIRLRLGLVEGTLVSVTRQMAKVESARSPAVDAGDTQLVKNLGRLKRAGQDDALVSEKNFYRERLQLTTMFSAILLENLRWISVSRYQRSAVVKVDVYSEEVFYWARHRWGLIQ